MRQLPPGRREEQEWHGPARYLEIRASFVLFVPLLCYWFLCCVLIFGVPHLKCVGRRFGQSQFCCTLSQSLYMHNPPFADAVKGGPLPGGDRAAAIAGIRYSFAVLSVI